jgi:hypothetical protein
MNPFDPSNPMPALPKRQPVFKVFYQDYGTGEAVSSAQPRGLLRDALAPLAERLLSVPDNYLGVIDLDDRVLQCYGADTPGRVVVEFLLADGRGGWQAELGLDAVLELLRDLPEGLSADLLPDARRLPG